MRRTTLITGAIAVGLVFLWCGACPAQEDAPPLEVRQKRAEQLLEGMNLSPEQRKQLMDRLLYPRRYFGDVDPGAEAPPRETAGQELTAEQREEVERFLVQGGAVSAERLEQLRAAEPREYEMRLRQMWRGIQEAKRVEDRHPERAERMRRTVLLEVRTQMLGSDYQAADEAGRKEIAKKLHDLLGEYYEVKTAMRRDEINRLREQLSNLEQQIDQRDKKRDQIIERQFMIVTGQGDPLEL